MSKRKNKLKENYSVELFILFLIIIISVFIYFFISYFSIINEKEIEVNAILDDNIGFDLSTDKLSFGKVIVENGASRSILLQNYYPYKVKIIIDSSGEISDYLFVSENEFILIPGETKKIIFTVFFPEGSELKMYGGKINIISKKVYG